MKAATAAMPSTITIRPSQKIQCQSSASTIGPGITRPTPKPMPKVEEISPMATGTRSRGNWSRTMPKASGKAAEPTPWTVRAAISRPRESDRAASRVPRAKTLRLAISTRFLPNMSPTRPSSAVATEADRRKELITQETPVVEAPNSSRRLGSAGTTIVCISEKDSTARSSAANGAAMERAAGAEAGASAGWWACRSSSGPPGRGRRRMRNGAGAPN